VPEMDLVTFHPATICREHLRPAGSLVTCENGVDVQEPQALRIPSLDSVGVVDPPAEHLQAAADSKHGTPALARAAIRAASPLRRR